MLGSRNRNGLNEHEIANCIAAWGLLCGDRPIPLVTNGSDQYGSRTRFNEGTNGVILGADAYPGGGPGANSRMSVLACLAHELAHVERFRLRYERPFSEPDVYIDEAETSLRASFVSVLSSRDREDLVEDARDRLIDW